MLDAIAEKEKQELLAGIDEEKHEIKRTDLLRRADEAIKDMAMRRSIKKHHSMKSSTVTLHTEIDETDCMKI